MQHTFTPESQFGEIFNVSFIYTALKSVFVRLTSGCSCVRVVSAPAINKYNSWEVPLMIKTFLSAGGCDPQRVSHILHLDRKKILHKSYLLNSIKILSCSYKKLLNPDSSKIVFCLQSGNTTSETCLSVVWKTNPWLNYHQHKIPINYFEPDDIIGKFIYEHFNTRLKTYFIK